ncbi:MAG TPA: hypothetical protein VLM18_01145 [Croceibacterium sp.]|nr:hypothetical protein [Croceibacterium sp.]
MDDFIPKGNIERFERKLKASRDDAERKVLLELLVIERELLIAARST